MLSFHGIPSFCPPPFQKQVEVEVGLSSINYLFCSHTYKIEKWKHYFHGHAEMTVLENSARLDNKLHD